MKRMLIAAMIAAGCVVGIEAAPTDVVTKADLQVLIERIAKLEAENQAQAKRIAELEAADRKIEQRPSEVVPDEGTTTNETGRIWTTAKGFKYYLADKGAGIFEPLSESGLRVTPYGYLMFEGVYNTHGTDADYDADWVKSPDSRGYDNHTMILTAQNSILGVQLDTPESHLGWTFTGRAEFDLAGDHANDYIFHWRHLYMNAAHESGWSFLFGQTWHLWKMVTPSEIDGAWMENTGHPYRRSPQFRVTKKWAWEDSSLEVRAGIVKNGPGMGGDRDDDGVQDNSASAWPLVEGAVVYDHDAAWEEKGKRWLVGIAGQYGQDRIRNEIDDRKDDYESMMLMAAGKIPLGDFTLTGQFFAGENLGGIQAGIGQRVGFDPATGDGREVRTIGGFIDLSYQLTDDWSFAIGYGFDNPDDNDAKYAEGRTFNDRAYIDAFYRITDNFKLGLEYGRLSTKYYDVGTGYSDRIQFCVFYDF